MKLLLRSSRTLRSAGVLLAVVLLAGFLLTALVPVPLGAEPLAEDPAKETAKPGVEPGAVEVRFTDNSTVKLTLKEEKLEIVTPYGKLLIPVADIRRVEVATRVPGETAKRIEKAIADLSSGEFKVREAASAELLKLKERAVPALLAAAKDKDMEVSRRAQDLLDRIRLLVSEEQMEVRKHDIILTETMKITGKIEAATLKATTFQFGEVVVKLADVRAIRSLTAESEVEVKNAPPCPPDFTALQNEVGKSFHFTLTGANSGSVWGSDVYTTDSTPAMAAVHAGALKVGQTAIVKVTIVVPPAGFDGTTRNGITTSNYGAYPGAYKISKPGDR
jgi:LCCL domain